MSIIETIISVVLAASLCSTWIWCENPCVDDPGILHLEWFWMKKPCVEHPWIKFAIDQVSEIVPNSVFKCFSPPTNLIKIHEHAGIAVGIFTGFSLYIILWNILYRATAKKRTHTVDPALELEPKDVGDQESDEDDPACEDDEIFVPKQFSIGPRCKSPVKKSKVGFRFSTDTQQVFAIACVVCEVKHKMTESQFQFPIRVAVVNEDLELVYDEYIRPSSSHSIENSLFSVHGISMDTIEKYGIALAQAVHDLLTLFQGHMVTGHDLQYVLRTLNIQYELTQSKLPMYDTARTRMFMSLFENKHCPCSLKELALDHLGFEMRRNGRQDPMEDAEISMRLYKKYQFTSWASPVLE